MSFLHPEFLYLMLPPVLLLFYFILTQKEPTAQLFDARVYERLRVNEKRLGLLHRNLIYLVIFILLITAMAQPVIHEATIKVAEREAVLTVALDISASMRTDDLYPSRLAVAKAKLLQLIDAAKHERVGVLAYGKDVYVLAPPTRDRALLRSMVERFEPDAYAEKGTNVMGLLAASGSVLGAEGERALILMTDGGDERDFRGAIAYANKADIRLYVLGIGTPQGAPLLLNGTPVMRNGKPVVTRLNPELHTLASGTGGVYVPLVTGSADTASLLKHLRERCGDAPGGVREVKQYGQLYILPLGFALFLLLIATSSMSRRETIAVPPMLLLGMFLFGQAGNLQAAAFDYELLGDAKRLYEEGAYPQAANAYYRYAKRNDDDPRALYDSAHALYRAGRYAAAAALWDGIRTKDRHLQFMALHNLGNAYAMQGGEEQLIAAVEVYQKALHVENDPLTRENLERVRGRLMRLMQQKLVAKEKTTAMREGRGAEADAGTQPARSDGAVSAPETPLGRGNDGASESADEMPTAAKMSDYEASLWLRTLNRQAQTHLYKLTQTDGEGGSDAPAW